MPDNAKVIPPPEVGTEKDEKEEASLLEIALDEANKFFCDQYGQAHVSFTKTLPGPHSETWPIASIETERWLVGSYFRQYKVPPTPTEVKLARRVMATKAWENGQRELHNRLAWHEGAIWIDMADPLWRAIRVSEGGWTIVSPTIPLFRRHLHQQALVDPASGGHLEKLLRFLPPMSRSEKLLCLVWTVLACVPTITRPMLLLVGHQGAAKSSACRRLRTLIDPSRVPLLGDDDRKDPILTLYQHAVPAFDNLGPFSRREADLFCRAVTGGGSHRRKLYSDTDEVILDFRRAILLNGIHLPSTRPDFLDRSLILRVERLKAHRPEEILNAEFAMALPQILGALLDVLARSMQLVGTMVAPKGFRMADFARWGRAVSVAMKWKTADFDLAYADSVNRQAKEVAGQDPVALAVIKLVNEKATAGQLPWITIAEDFFPKLDDSARDLELFGPMWPGGRSAMSERVEGLIPTLLTLGIKVTKLPRTGSVRSRWKLEKANDKMVHS